MNTIVTSLLPWFLGLALTASTERPTPAVTGCWCCPPECCVGSCDDCPPDCCPPECCVVGCCDSAGASAAPADSCGFGPGVAAAGSCCGR